jgi:hypothetical protein
MRDARPFVAHHLRQRANERRTSNGDALHALARWIENLPARDPRMARIEATGALDYDDGTLTGGAQSEALVESYTDEGDHGRELWLDRYADAVSRAWQDSTSGT